MIPTTKVESVLFSRVERSRLRSLVRKSATLLVLLGAATLVAAGCDDTAIGPGAGGTKGGVSGSGGAGGATAAPAIGCSDPDPGVVDFLDDMEDGNAVILGRDGRIGSWYTFHDKTDGVLNPQQDTTPVMEPIPGGRCGAGISTRAMRVTGSGFIDWGAGFGFALRYGSGKEQPYDATRFTGITFWARTGETSVKDVQLGIGDQWSRPDGGNCDITVNSGPTACYDTFGSLVTFSPTWQRYTIKFGQMQQRNFGLMRPMLDQTTLMSIEFGIPPGAPVFDVWIDDIAFFQ